MDGYVGGERIVKIAYSGGQVVRCAPRGPAHERACPAIGETRTAPPPLSDAAVKAPVSVKVRRASGERVLTVRFQARVAVNNARAAYWISVHVPGASGKCGYTTGGPVSHDVRAGEEVGTSQRVSDACRGRFLVSVTYTRTDASDAFPSPGGDPGMRALPVGERSVSIP